MPPPECRPRILPASRRRTRLECRRRSRPGSHPRYRPECPLESHRQCRPLQSHRLEYRLRSPLYALDANRTEGAERPIRSHRREAADRVANRTEPRGLGGRPIRGHGCYRKHTQRHGCGAEEANEFRIHSREPRAIGRVAVMPPAGDLSRTGRKMGRACGNSGRNPSQHLDRPDSPSQPSRMAEVLQRSDSARHGCREAVNRWKGGFGVREMNAHDKSRRGMTGAKHRGWLVLAGRFSGTSGGNAAAPGFCDPDH